MLKSEGNYFYIIMDFWYFSCQNSGDNYQDAILQCRRSLYFCCQNPGDNFHDAILPCRRYFNSYTVKPVLGGHLSDKEKVAL